MILNGDSLEVLRGFETDTVDAVITDPPYGYSFMGKNWDKAVPSVDIWRECLRVLKPGGWCMVMSAPRSDVQNAMISRLMEAGFRLDFTPIYWTYASGFPKAGNVGKLVDKRLGGTPVQGEPKPYTNDKGIQGGSFSKGNYERVQTYYTTPGTDEAKALDGSYTGFQPKPAVEVIIVAMKPLSEKTYVDQALKNGKGITWLDDCRVPTDSAEQTTMVRDKGGYGNSTDGVDFVPTINYTPSTQGRFPANLVVSDDVLNGHSKFFDLDKWHERNAYETEHQRSEGRETVFSDMEGRHLAHDDTHSRHTTEPTLSTLPFLIVPKASKSEKNKGLEHLEEQLAGGMSGTRDGSMLTGSGNVRNNMAKNHHPTVKPLKLMSYLITLTTRPGDTVLDPFVGSGTTVVAAKQLGRIGIGIEREAEYAEIAQARVEAAEKVEPPEEKQLSLV